MRAGRNGDGAMMMDYRFLDSRQSDYAFLFLVTA